VSSDIELRKVATALNQQNNILKSQTTAIKDLTTVLRTIANQMSWITAYMNSGGPYFPREGRNAQEGEAGAGPEEEGGISSRGEASGPGGLGEVKTSEGGEEV
jgi:hypothetical protein